MTRTINKPIQGIFTNLETRLVILRIQLLERMQAKGIELNAYEGYTLMLFRAELDYRAQVRMDKCTTQQEPTWNATNSQPPTSSAQESIEALDPVGIETTQMPATSIE